MYLSESFVVAALAAAPVLATGSSVNVYWGQQGNGDLATACQDPSIDYITLGFVNISPENGGPTEYPGTNFGAHCWADKYSADGHTSQLLSTCPSLTPGIAVCQGLGKKVLLSIGGVYGAYSNYTVSTPVNGVEFAQFVWGAFGPYTEAWAGKPRPFDHGDQHNAVDGFDFDLESSSAGDEGYAAMINALRGLIAVSGRDDIITAAPQCPLDEWQTMTYLLENVQFDRLWIQFYNNPQCSLLQADGSPNPGFNYAAWEKYLAKTPSKGAKLHIGLPGSRDAAGSGYVDASVASTHLCKYGDHPMFGGVMVWDQWFAAQNTIDGASYNQVLYESMKCGCKECPVPTSTISTTASASTTAASTSLSTAPPVTITSSTSAPPTSTPSCTGVAGWDKDGTNIGFYADAASATYSGCLALCDANEACLSFGVLSTPACALYSYTVEGNVVVDASSGHSFYNKGGVCPQPSSSSTAVTSPSETTSLSSTSVSVESSTAFTASTTSDVTTTYTLGTSTYSATTSSVESASRSETSTAEVPPAISETAGASISSTANWSNITWTTASTSESQTVPTTVITTSSFHLSTRPPTWSNSTWTSHGPSSIAETETTASSTTLITSTSVATEPSSPGSGEHTTETFYSTTVVTVTSCAPTVTNCPGTPHVTTSIITITSTVGPVHSSGGDETVTATVVPITSTSAGPVPGSEQMTTSTIYSTTVYTVTSCAPAVTDCPGRLGSVTMQIIAISTTVCPVTEAGHTGPTPPVENGGGGGSTPSETKPVGSGPSPSAPAGGEGENFNPSPSSPAGGEGSHLSPPEGAEEGSTTTTVHTNVDSTITLPVVSVPTAGNEAYAPPPVNNAGAGPSHVFGNSTVTKTFSLATVKPTGAGAPAPQNTVVTAGAARGIVGAGMTIVVGVMVFML
ncbi:hypothetical protein DHEL01_v200416 [Diaporthe helianthi]|uniref:chitinase n=1 Tax=Diaporthe helianthi TaxID=158607 RepID=A0A2P5IFC3_DIAHE|nr:hypothetical protein DHEL01_v200416 [Diaporthe helianthi]